MCALVSLPTNVVPCSVRVVPGARVILNWCIIMKTVFIYLCLYCYYYLAILLFLFTISTLPGTQESILIRRPILSVYSCIYYGESGRSDYSQNLWTWRVGIMTTPAFKERIKLKLEWMCQHCRLAEWVARFRWSKITWLPTRTNLFGRYL